MGRLLTVHDSERNPIYDIVIEKNFDLLADKIGAAGLSDRKFCIVADSNTAPLYACELKKSIASVSRQTELFVFPAGEENKTLDVVRQLYAFLIEHKFERRDCLIALGGGVVGDLTGFAAATYLRGIAFIQVPTTLLAQSDSSVGGKTGVDFDGYKNMVGAFKMPSLVYMNVSTLKSLGERVYLSGMGEVIKHGYIRDLHFLEYVNKHTEEILARDEDTMIDVAYGNCNIKRCVVEEDPTEKGIRGLLNFGHTLGHAIEKQRAKDLYHGECVSIGMAGAAFLSRKKGLITIEEEETLRRTLSSLHLPVSDALFSPAEALEATKSDKKMQNGSIRFILLKKVGEAYIDKNVTLEEMADALSYICLKPGEEPNQD